MGMTSVRMPDDLLNQLEQTAERLERSKAWLINNAVKDYLQREARQSQMLEDTLEALNDIKAGRVVDGSDMLDWLDSWGSDTEKAPPG